MKGDGPRPGNRYIGSFYEMTYQEFLQSKVELAPSSGFEVAAGEINPALKPHQKDAVRWALRGGRRALFESFGLGKTVQAAECEIDMPTLFDFMDGGKECQDE